MSYYDISPWASDDECKSVQYTLDINESLPPHKCEICSPLALSHCVTAYTPTFIFNC